MTDWKRATEDMEPGDYLIWYVDNGSLFHNGIEHPMVAEFIQAGADSVDELAVTNGITLIWSNGRWLSVNPDHPPIEIRWIADIDAPPEIEL